MIVKHQHDFYREFLMQRGKFEPKDFGVDMDKDDFIDLMVNEFNDYVKGSMSFDELLLNPSHALHFVTSVRSKHGYFSLPDDIILRSVMIRRKNPKG